MSSEYCQQIGMLVRWSPLTSERLIMQTKLLFPELGDAAIRQRIQRTVKQGDICILEDVKLQGNARIYYFPTKKFQAQTYYERLRWNQDRKNEKTQKLCNEDLHTWHATTKVKEWIATLPYGDVSATINMVLERHIRRSRPNARVTKASDSAPVQRRRRNNSIQAE